MLVAPGAGDDTQPRMALHALTWYFGSAGTAAQRDRYIDALCEALDADKPSQVKAFFIRQLQLLGGDRAVPTLARFLNDEQLCHPATVALVAIGGDAAAAALRDALARSAGDRRLAIIDALGALRDTAAAEPLRRLARRPDGPVRWAALAALGNIGDEYLAAARRSAPEMSWYDKCRFQELLLRACRMLAARGRLPPALKELVALLADSHQAVQVRCAALRLRAALERAAAVPDLLRAMGGDSAELRAAAANIAAELPGAELTRALAKGLAALEDADVRVALLNVLARRGDAAALPAAVDALSDENRAVRLAAVAAVAALGREKAVPPLVAFLDRGNAEQRSAAEDALAGLRGEGVARRIAQAMADQSATTGARLLNVLARRRARDQLEAIYRCAGDERPEVRIAAIRGIGKLADERAAPKLLALLERAGSEAEREAAELALASTCRRAVSPAMRARPILGALDRAARDNYCSLLRVLGRIGGDEALAVLRAAVDDERPEVRRAAIGAFLGWPDAGAAGAVLEIARRAGDTREHVLALRAYARLLRLPGQRPIQATLDLYAAGLEAARRPEERKLLLAGLGEVKDAAALGLLERYLADSGLRDEAAAALVSVAEKILPAGWHDARPALETVLAKTASQNIRRRAQNVLNRVAEYEDYITDWLVSGPYRRGHARGDKLFDVAFPPEDPDATGVEWREQPPTPDPARYWLIDLVRSCGGSHPVGYLRTYVYSPGAQAALLELGSDDGVKLWLNRELIHANNVARGCDRAQDRVSATLKPGWNELLLKITNIGGGWGACLRVRAPGGDHLDGLRIDARRRPGQPAER